MAQRITCGSSSEDETSDPNIAINSLRMAKQWLTHLPRQRYCRHSKPDKMTMKELHDLKFAGVYPGRLTQMSLPIFDMRKVPVFSRGHYDKCLADKQISRDVLMETVSNNMKADKNLIHIIEDTSCKEGTRKKTSIVILPQNQAPNVCYLIFEVKETAAQFTPTLLCGRFNFETSIKEIRDHLLKERKCRMLGLLVNGRVPKSELSVADCDLKNLSKIQVMQLPSFTVKFTFRPQADVDMTFTLKDVDMNSSVAEVKFQFIERFGTVLNKYKTEGKDMVHFCISDKLLQPDMCIGLVAQRRDEVISVHLSAADVIYVNVKFRKPLRVDPKVMIVQRKCSTKELREEIANLLAEPRDPKSIKATLKGSLIEEHDNLSEQYMEEWHDGIGISVGVKKCKNLKIKNQNMKEEMTVEIYMLENVSVLKKKVAERWDLNENTISLLCKGMRMQSNHLLQQYPIKNNMEITLYWFPNRIHVNVDIVFQRKRVTVFIDDRTTFTVDDLLRYCAHEFDYCRASSRGIFKNHCLNKGSTLQQEGICHGDKVIIVRFDQPKNFSDPAWITVFEATDFGYIHELLGTIQGSRLFFAARRDWQPEHRGDEVWNNGPCPCGIKLCDEADCTVLKRTVKKEDKDGGKPKTRSSAQSRKDIAALKQKFITPARKLRASISSNSSTTSETQRVNQIRADSAETLNLQSLDRSANQSPVPQIDEDMENLTRGETFVKSTVATSRGETCVENEETAKMPVSTLDKMLTSTPIDKSRPHFYCDSLPDMTNAMGSPPQSLHEGSNQEHSVEETKRTPTSRSMASVDPQILSQSHIPELHQTSTKKISNELSDETFLKKTSQGNIKQRMPSDLNVNDFKGDTKDKASDKNHEQENMGALIRQSVFEPIISSTRAPDTQASQVERHASLSEIEQTVGMEIERRVKEIDVGAPGLQESVVGCGNDHDDLAADHRGQDKDKRETGESGQEDKRDSAEIGQEANMENHDVRQETWRESQGRPENDYTYSESNNIVAQESAVESASESDVEPNNERSMNRRDLFLYGACKRGGSCDFESDSELERRRKCIDKRRIARLKESRKGNHRQSAHRRERYGDSPQGSCDHDGNESVENVNNHDSYHSESELGAVGGVPYNQLAPTERLVIRRQISIHDMMEETHPGTPNAGMSDGENGHPNVVVQHRQTMKEWRCQPCVEKGGSRFCWTVCPYHQQWRSNIPLLCNMYTCKELLRGMHQQFVKNAGRTRASSSESRAVQSTNPHRVYSEAQLELNGDLQHLCPVLQNWHAEHNSAVVVHRKIHGTSGMTEQFDYISTNIGEDWKRLVRKLGLPEPSVTHISNAHSKDLREAAYQALLAWQHHKGSDGTFQALHAALLHISRKDLADNLLPNPHTA